MKDSNDDDEDNAANEDDEVEVYEAVDEEEQTAAQVLAEANALSARIIKIVNGWYGGGGGGDSDGRENSNNGEKVKGLILGEDEGALCLAAGGEGGGNATSGGDDGDEAWISNETMKGLLPNVKLAEYQLLGVNWMALLNRTKFGGGKTSKNVSGILADEMGLGKVSKRSVRDVTRCIRVLFRCVVAARSPFSARILSRPSPDSPNDRVPGVAQPSEQGWRRPRARGVVLLRDVAATAPPHRRARVCPVQLDERIQEIRPGHDRVQVPRQSGGAGGDTRSYGTRFRPGGRSPRCGPDDVLVLQLGQQ